MIELLFNLGKDPRLKSLGNLDLRLVDGDTIIARHPYECIKAIGKIEDNEKLAEQMDTIMRTTNLPYELKADYKGFAEFYFKKKGKKRRKRGKNKLKLN